jgi:hypothetical protein
VFLNWLPAGRLCFVVSNTRPETRPGTHVFSTDETLQYTPFCVSTPSKSKNSLNEILLDKLSFASVIEYFLVCRRTLGQSTWCAPALDFFSPVPTVSSFSIFLLTARFDAVQGMTYQYIAMMQVSTPTGRDRRLSEKAFASKNPS